LEKKAVITLAFNDLRPIRSKETTGMSSICGLLKNLRLLTVFFGH